MSDDGENELTSEDKRILKYVADAAREEMPTRRQALKGGTAAAAVGMLGFGAGTASADADTNDQYGDVGTPSNRVDVFSDGVDANSVSTPEVNNIYSPEPGTDLAPLVGDDTGILLRPGATYELSAPIPPTDRFALVTLGDTHELAIVNYTGSTGSGTVGFADWSDASTPISRTTISGVHIDAGGAEQAIVGYYLTNNTQLNNIKVDNTTGDAVELSKIWYAWANNVGVKGSDGVGGDAFNIHEGAGDVTDLTMKRPRVNGCGGVGIRLSGGNARRNIDIRRPVVEKTDSHGIVQNGLNATVLNPYFEAVGQSETTPRNIYSTGSGNAALAIIGGQYQGVPSGVSIDIDNSGVQGAIIGGVFGISDGSNRPTGHIRSTSPGFSVMSPTSISFASGTNFDIEGYYWGSSSPGHEVSSRQRPQDLSTVTGRFTGETLADDGTNTNRSGTLCTWDEGSGNWVPQDGSSTFAP